MATWTVSDELDARLRKRLKHGDVAGYVEALITDQLNQDDPSYQAAVDAQMTASERDIASGRVVDARDAMRSIARDKGIKLNR